MISDDHLLQLNGQGIFPGPDETMAAFAQRAQYGGGCEAAPQREGAEEITQKLFGFRGHWMRVVFSNNKLRSWEAAATWIAPQEAPTIQLRRALQKGSYLGLYSLSEVLSHEMLHVARAPFGDSKYEEMMAYLTSTQWLRRTVGPLFRTPRESLVYAVAIGLSVCAPGLWLIPLLLTSLFSWRLVKVRRTFRKTLRGLCTITPHPLAMLVRLTDEEIDAMAAWDREAILLYAKSQSSLRWRLLNLAYVDAQMQRSSAGGDISQLSDVHRAFRETAWHARAPHRREESADPPRE